MNDYILFLPCFPERKPGQAEKIIADLSYHGFSFKVAASFSEYLDHGIQGYKAVLADLFFNYDRGHEEPRFEYFKKKTPAIPVLVYFQNWSEHRPIHYKATKAICQSDHFYDSTFLSVIKGHLKEGEFGVRALGSRQYGEVLYYGSAEALRPTGRPFTPTTPTGATGRRHFRDLSSAGTPDNELIKSLSGIWKRRREAIELAAAGDEESAVTVATETAENDAPQGNAIAKAMIQRRKLQKLRIGKHR